MEATLATIAYYLDIAEAVYQRGPSPLGRWRVQKWETATWYGDGFQGGIFEDDREVIVAFSGTLGNLVTAPISQNSANARIGIFVIPNMAGTAKTLVQWAETNRGNKPVSIVGHSLGGALAQVVGAWSGHPFISFNGPGMAAHLKVSAFNVFKPRQMMRSIKTQSGNAVGLCINVQGDFVGSYGLGHVGEVMWLEAPVGWETHDLDIIGRSLSSEQLNAEPWKLSTGWPVLPNSNTPPQLDVRPHGSSFTTLVQTRLRIN
jgi:hypothetical protein